MDSASDRVRPLRWGTLGLDNERKDSIFDSHYYKKGGQWIFVQFLCNIYHIWLETQIHIISTRFLLSIWNVWNVLCFKFKQFYVFSNSSWEDDKALCWSFSHSRDIPSGMVILLNRKSQMIIGQVMLIHAQTSMVRNF